MQQLTDCDYDPFNTYYVVVHPVGLVLTVVTLAFLCRGFLSVLVPRRFARRFGIEGANPAALAAIRAAGMRDGVIGLSAILLTAMGYHAAVGVLALAGAMVALSDAFIILRQVGAINRLDLWMPAVALSMLGLARLLSLPTSLLLAPPPTFYPW